MLEELERVQIDPGWAVVTIRLLQPDLPRALQILRIMKSTGKPLSELKRCLKKYPQAQRNLRVKQKPPLEELPEVMKLVGEAEKELNGKGRVLLRYSGTEPKIRLLIEGREPAQIDRQANRIADAIQGAIGISN